jgi:hypothetical protein
MGRLHAEFWGIPITLEVEASSVERGMPSGRVDESSDSSTDAEDDEIIPGCGVLHFGNRLIPYEDIWIRVSVFISGSISIVLTNLVG